MTLTIGLAVRRKKDRLFCMLPETTSIGLNVNPLRLRRILLSPSRVRDAYGRHNVCDARHGSNFFIRENFRRELIRFSRSYRFPLKFALRLVSAEQIVQSPVEEISNHIVEFLNAVEFEWDHFARNQRFAGEYDSAMFSNVLAKMLFYQDQAEDDFTRRNSLL